jgi:AcrR family transcriptional regulator
MAEYARVGFEAARVEDIVTAAGVSWGTFFHYFPAKEDVLLDAAAEVCRAYAEAVQAGLEDGQDTESVLEAAFGAMSLAAAEAAPSNALRGKLLLYVLGHPGRLTEFLGEDVAPPVRPRPRRSPRASSAGRSARTSPPNRWRSSCCTPSCSPAAAARRSAGHPARRR